MTKTRRNLYLMLIAGAFIISRFIYYWMGVRFETAPLLFYWQIMDPALLRDAPWQSLFYSRSQLPGFNLYLILVMKVFGPHSLLAFHATFLGLGLTSAICLFLLLERLRVSYPLSFVIALVAAISPVAALYENWLFYEYPLAVLFGMSALFLHRYASAGRRLDGLAFFTSLLFIALLRVIYSLFWFWIIVAITTWALRRRWRRTLLCATLPGTILFIAYLKSIILFGLWMPGSDDFGAINLAHMASDAVPKDVLAMMAAQGSISQVLMPALQFRLEDPALLKFIRPPTETGIPILDNRLKSTGRINMDSLFMAAVGRQLRQDALHVLHRYPRAYLIGIGHNTVRYFLPADHDWPFDGSRPPNQMALSRVLTGFDLVVAGNHPATRVALTAYFTIPLLLGYGLWRFTRRLRRIYDGSSNSNDLTIVFAFGNIAYMTVVAIFFACADQNRFMFEVFPLFAVLLGSWTVLFRRRFRKATGAVAVSATGRQ
jgi:hypothetical protein